MSLVDTGSHDSILDLFWTVYNFSVKSNCRETRGFGRFNFSSIHHVLTFVTSK